MKKEQGSFPAFAVSGVFIFFLGYIMVSFLMKNVCYEMLGMSGPVVQYFAQLETEGDGDEAVETVDVDWESLYPFAGEGQSEEGTAKGAGVFSRLCGGIVEKYLAGMEKVVFKIEWYADNSTPFRTGMVQLYAKAKAAFGITMQASSDGILYMENGYLTYAEPKVPEKKILEIADSVEDFRDFLADREIPFLYVNCGSKVCPTDRQYTPGMVEYTNENGDALEASLAERNVDFLDFRQEMLEAGLDWYGAYYKTDHHWTTETGLWAAGVLADKLNRDYGFAFDAACFSPESYSMTRYENYWLGCQGRADAFAHSDLEDYLEILPKYETNYSLKCPSNGLDLRGNYSETLFDVEQLEKIGRYSREDYLSRKDAYSCSRISNAPLTQIRNLLPTDNQGKKILFLQDSFSFYSTGYLAADVESIDVLYPGAFTGSIREYVRQAEPDMVILMYCERNIQEIDWSGHGSMFDFR